MTALTVNGTRRSRSTDPRHPAALRAAQRPRAGRGRGSAAGWGCAAPASCCVDGAVVPSCDTPLWSVDGQAGHHRRGLSRRRLHPVQQTLLDEQAAQCGYCMTGMVVTARGPAGARARTSTEAERGRALERNLCRCGAHNRIVRAVLGARPCAMTDRSPKDLAEPTRAWPRWIRSTRTAASLVRVGQGRARPGHPHRAGPDRRRRARRRPGRVADACRPPPTRPRRGPHRRQPVGAALRAGAAGRLRAACGRCTSPPRPRGWPVPADASPSPTARSARRTAGAPATGSWPPRRPGRRRPTPPSRLGRLRGRRPRRAAARPAGQGRRPAAVPPRPAAAGPCCTAACCGRRRAAPAARARRHRGRPAPGVVAVVRDGSFLGVVAEREETSLRALAALRAGQSGRSTTRLPDEDDLADVPAWPRPPRRPVLADDRRRGRGHRPTRRCGARVQPAVPRARLDRAELRARASGTRGRRRRSGRHSQGIDNLRDGDRRRARRWTRRPSSSEHVEGAGCYGHNARRRRRLRRGAAGPRRARAARCRCSGAAQDELSWGPFSPGDGGRRRGATWTRPAGSQRWRYDVWSQGHSSPPRLRRRARPAGRDARGRRRPTYPAAVDPPLRERRRQHAATRVPALRPAQPAGHRPPADRVAAAHVGDAGARRATSTSSRSSRWWTSWPRSPALDPVEFRLAHLPDDAGARGAASWPRRRPAGAAPVPEGTGLGVGFARYKDTGAWCAVVAEVEAEADVRVRRLTVAVDVGLVVNPDGVRNQIEGGAVQATELDADGAGPLRPAPGHQRRPGSRTRSCRSRAVPRGRRRPRRPATATRRSAPARPPRARPPPRSATRSHAARRRAGPRPAADPRSQWSGDRRE